MLVVRRDQPNRGSLLVGVPEVAKTAGVHAAQTACKKGPDW
jgi:hypothetical protein